MEKILLASPRISYLLQYLDCRYLGRCKIFSVNSVLGRKSEFQVSVGSHKTGSCLGF